MKWQPIETAPKDGTPILAAGRYWYANKPLKEFTMTTVYWDTADWFLCVAGLYAEDRSFDIAEFWIPLPEPPHRNANDEHRD